IILSPFRIIRKKKGSVYSIRTLLLLLNQNLPLEMIFSVNAESIFSCVKLLVIVDTVLDWAVNCFLKAGKSAIEWYPGYWATAEKEMRQRNPQARFLAQRKGLVRVT